MSELELDFYTVIDGGLEAGRLKVEDNEEISVTELLPGVFEVVILDEYVDLLPLAGMFAKLGSADILTPDVLMTEWIELEDGRLSRTVMRP